MLEALGNQKIDNPAKCTVSVNSDSFNKLKGKTKIT